MVKAHCVAITAQVDMNFIVLCERIMELQPSKTFEFAASIEEDELSVTLIW